MFRLLIGLAFKLTHTGYNLKLLLLFLGILLLGYLLKVWNQVGKQ